MVDNFVISTQGRILRLERMQAVRASSHNAWGIDLVQGLHVGIGQLVEEKFVARTAGGVAGAALLGPQDREVHPRLIENFGKGPCRSLRAGIRSRRATHPPQYLGVRVLLNRWNV